MDGGIEQNPAYGTAPTFIYARFFRSKLRFDPTIYPNRVRIGPCERLERMIIEASPLASDGINFDST
jgi:hypothetical protein